MPTGEFCVCVCVCVNLSPGGYGRRGLYNETHPGSLVLALGAGRHGPMREE